jgi:hypothetical protein
MKTPKEKAEELVNKMWVYALPNANGSWQNAKQCALIAVDEILLITRESYDIDHINWWQEVKTEIENL